jgi:hypothetical protein
MSRLHYTAWDAPVFDGEWCETYGMTTYWSPCNIIENPPYYNKEPFYEDFWDFDYKNHPINL